MDPLTSSLLLFFVGVVSGIINVMAGGGSSLTLPVLIFLGLDSALANGTNRIAIVVQNLAAVSSFKKEKYSQFGISIKLSLVTLPGSIIGAVAAVKMSDALFQKILAVVMIGIIISMIVPKSKAVYSDDPNKKISFWTHLSMFFIGFYGGFLQVGVGFLLMGALHYLMKLNLVYVNMHKVFIVFFFTLPALLIFIITGNVNWFFGLSLAAGNGLGAWWAAKISVKKGEGVIKIILFIAIFIMALKLLNVF
ncbi:MAG: sulfite exporter TauE/SafE family protein [Ignavibacteriaceae bacterium]|nr:sulfite exporter TauE/SafE family protein [Ignavibacteriaceae bacterium]